MIMPVQKTAANIWRPRSLRSHRTCPNQVRGVSRLRERVGVWVTGGGWAGLATYGAWLSPLALFSPTAQVLDVVD